MKYYLAGPMSNKPFLNYPLFDSVAATLRRVGYNITSPAEMDDTSTRAEALANEDGIPSQHDRGETWGDFLARDVKMIADELEAIILLPEWETSRGARLEAFVSINCGYPAFEYLTNDNGWVCKPISDKLVMEKISASIF